MSTVSSGSQFVWLDYKRYSRAIRSHTGLSDHLGKLLGKKDVRWLLGEDDHLALLVDSIGHPIASLRVVEKGDHKLLRNVIVAPHHRGQGLCGKLVEKVLEKIPTGAVMLDVAPDNVPAIKCYMSAGFEFTGLTVVYDGHQYQRLTLAR